MIELTRDGALWRLPIGRPERANFLTTGVLADLASRTQAACADHVAAIRNLVC